MDAQTLLYYVLSIGVVVLIVVSIIVGVALYSFLSSLKKMSQGASELIDTFQNFKDGAASGRTASYILSTLFYIAKKGIRRIF